MKIVAVSACPAGLMHTYMAAESALKEAKKRNIDIKIETHGAIGVENKLTSDDISSSDVVLLMTDVFIDKNRFDGKNVVSVSTAEAIRNIETLFDQIGDIK